MIHKLQAERQSGGGGGGDLVWAFETSTQSPATHFLQPSNKATSPNLHQRVHNSGTNSQTYEPIGVVLVQTTTVAKRLFLNRHPILYMRNTTHGKLATVVRLYLQQNFKQQPNKQAVVAGSTHWNKVESYFRKGNLLSHDKNHYSGQLNP